MLPPLPRCSRRAQTSLKLARLYQPSPKWVSGRPAHRPFRGLLSVHSRCGLHTRTVTYVTVIRGLQTFRHLHACPGCFRLEQLAGWVLHPLESAAFARRTPYPVVPHPIGASQKRTSVHAAQSRFFARADQRAGRREVGLSRHSHRLRRTRVCGRSEVSGVSRDPGVDRARAAGCRPADIGKTIADRGQSFRVDVSSRLMSPYGVEHSKPYSNARGTIRHARQWRNLLAECYE